MAVATHSRVKQSKAKIIREVLDKRAAAGKDVSSAWGVNAEILKAAQAIRDDIKLSDIGFYKHGWRKANGYSTEVRKPVVSKSLVPVMSKSVKVTTVFNADDVIDAMEQLQALHLNGMGKDRMMKMVEMICKD